MKKTICIFSIIVSCAIISNVFAQSNTLACGDSKTVDGHGSVSYSFGQVFYQSESNATHNITEGLQHAYQLKALLNLVFGQGYTWFSVNVNPGSMNPNTVFTNLSPCPNDRIIGQSGFSAYSGANWIGQVNTINENNMYKVKLCSNQQITVSGQAVANNPISLNSGYTWLGYLPQECLNVNTALSNLNPVALPNDRIIGQNSFATFTGAAWIGSLTNLCPGGGYVLKLTNSSTLTYPASQGKSFNDIVETEISSPAGLYPSEYLQHTMTILGKLQLTEGIFSINPNDVVYAFVDGACRGIANPMSEHEGLIFMNVGENSEDAKQVEFRVWLESEQKLVPINEKIPFASLQNQGELNDPFIFTLAEITDISELASTVFIGEPFPNPFKEKTTIRYTIPQSAQIHLTVLNTLGQHIYSTSQNHTKSGSYSIEFENTNLAKGLYYYNVEVLSGENRIMKAGKLIIN